MTKFWIEDPCVLFTDLAFFPMSDMTQEQKLNALTRLAIIISVAAFAMKYKNWLSLLLISLLIIILIQYSSKRKNSGNNTVGTGNEEYTPAEPMREHFTIVPTHIDDDFSTTVVAPTFAEEHRVPPVAYDFYTNVNDTALFQEPLKPQAYPYGQYLTHTNLMPQDEYAVHLNPSGGARSAKSYVNSMFTKHELAFREDLTRLHKKSLERRWRHSSQDSWSPFHSY